MTERDQHCPLEDDDPQESRSQGSVPRDECASSSWSLSSSSSMSGRSISKFDAGQVRTRDDKRGDGVGGVCTHVEHGHECRLSSQGREHVVLLVDGRHGLLHIVPHRSPLEYVAQHRAKQSWLGGCRSSSRRRAAKKDYAFLAGASTAPD
jgi:hypothetical protein